MTVLPTVPLPLPWVFDNKKLFLSILSSYVLGNSKHRLEIITFSFSFSQSGFLGMIRKNLLGHRSSDVLIT